MDKGQLKKLRIKNQELRIQELRIQEETGLPVSFEFKGVNSKFKKLN